MALYAYRAIDGDGRLVQGSLEAADQQAAVDHLSATGLLPVEATPQAARGQHRSMPHRAARQRVPAAQILLFTRKLAAVIQAGLDLDKGIEIAGSAARAPAIRRVVARVLADIRSGKALSEALAAHEAAFPRYYVPMVRAGEAGGSLGPAIARIASLMDQSEKLRRGVTSALVYPAILVVTAIGSIVLLMTVVIPRFEPLFRDAGRELPLMTRVFMGASETVTRDGPLVLLALLVGFLLFRRKRQNPDFRLRTDRLLLRVPLIGGAILRMQVAILARTLGMLLQNGVALLAGLSIVETSLGNAALAAELRAARLAVKDGSPLTQALQRGGVFPDLLLQLAAVGEASGRLPEMLVEAGAIYDEEVQTTIQRMLALLTPIVTLGLSLLIAAIIGSVLMAILSVNDLVL